MAGLVEEIQARAIDPNTKVSDLLRMVKLAATKLKLHGTVAWVDHELSGYLGFEDKDVPRYRHGSGQLKERIPNHGVRVAFGDAKMIAAFSMIVMRESVSGLEELAASNGQLAMPLDANFQDAINKANGHSFGYEIHFGSNVPISAISAVKDMVLDWACGLGSVEIHRELITVAAR